MHAICELMDAAHTTSDFTGRSGSEKEPLQVRIPRNIKRRFKAKAAMLGVEPNELFVRMWDMYERAEDERS